LLTRCQQSITLRRVRACGVRAKLSPLRRLYESYSKRGFVLDFYDWKKLIFTTKKEGMILI
jgi:hypothetical protein